jgi:hypothetical protein
MGVFGNGHPGRAPEALAPHTALVGTYNKSDHTAASKLLGPFSKLQILLAERANRRIRARAT